MSYVVDAGLDLIFGDKDVPGFRPRAEGSIARAGGYLPLPNPHLTAARPTGCFGSQAAIVAQDVWPTAPGDKQPLTVSM